jgi:hypothetical protein
LLLHNKLIVLRLLLLFEWRNRKPHMTYISNVVDDPQFDAIIVSNIINDITTGKTNLGTGPA